MFRYRAGRMTVALSLIVLGVALLADNLQGTSYTSLVIRFWPLLLVGMGVEYLGAVMLAEHKGWGRPSLAWGGVIFILILGLVISGVQRIGFTGLNDVLRINWQVNTGHVAWGDREYTVPAAGVQNINAAVNVGSVELVPATDNQVHVHAHYSMRGDTQAEADRLVADASRFDLVITQTGDRLRIDPQWKGTEKGSVDLTIQVPAGLTLDASSGAGKIRVRDLDAKMTLHSSVGEVTVDRSKGSLTANTGAGTINVDRFVGPVHLETETGKVSAQDVAGDAFVRTSTGRVDLQNYKSGRLQASASTGAVNVEYATSPTADAEITADVGSVTVRLPKGADVKVSAHSKTAAIHGPSWLAVERRTMGADASGVSGNGAVTLQLRTGMGSIEIEE